MSIYCENCGTEIIHDDTKSKCMHCQATNHNEKTDDDWPQCKMAGCLNNAQYVQHESLVCEPCSITENFRIRLVTEKFSTINWAY